MTAPTLRPPAASPPPPAAPRAPGPAARPPAPPRTFAERLRAVPSHPMWRRRWPLVGLLAVAAVVVLADVWLYTCGFAGCPSAADIRAYRPSEGGRIYDRAGATMGRLVPVRRVNVPLRDVPSHVRTAFVAVEDRRFLDHDGVDWRGFVRAVGANVRAMGVREGFSTITMQVVRNTFATERAGERSLQRKMLELRLSRLLEQTLSKQQILELYLNAIYLGNGVYGVEAASRDLFGKGVSDISLAQGAMLAALPKGPSAYTPRRAPQRALRRRNLVLAIMAREGYISADRAQRAMREKLVIQRNQWRPDSRNDSYALDEVRAFVDSVREAQGIESKDLAVYTALDLRAQRAAEAAVRRRADVIEREAGREGVEGAMVAIDPRTGEVRALVGGRRYERGNFDRAINGRRQPGSAFKPFVYAAALASGMTPASEVDDEPVEVVIDGRVWAPGNYDDDYQGRTTLRRALMRSANAATVRVSRAVGEDRVVRAARLNGIVSPLRPVPSIALGALEVSPLELVTAYAPFANGGYRVRPTLVRRIEDGEGTVIWTADSTRTPVMDPRDAFLLTSMLRSVVDHGTGRPVRDWGVSDPVAGKTGTTNAGNDVWFVGYTPTLVAGFWFGYDDPRPLGPNPSGGRLAAPAWADFYRAGWRERGEWRAPAGLVQRTIDAYNGQLANDFCPVVQREWFRAGTEPTGVCEEHIAPPEPDPWGTDVWGQTPPGEQPPVVDEARRAAKKTEKWFKRIFKW